MSVRPTNTIAKAMAFILSTMLQQLYKLH
jgi:hypothetical protein